MVIAAPNVTVGVEDGRIVEAAGPPDVVLPSGVLAPGLIDLQVNGCFGVDFAHDEDWSAAAARLPETGVTAFLPTFITAPLDDLVDGLRRVPRSLPGARILGVHVEGPFLAAERKGAHDASLFRDPEPELIDALLEPRTMALITLAPERAGALEAISRLAAAGVLVSVGHSDARADDGGGGRRCGRADGHAPLQRDARDPPPRARASRGRRWPIQRLACGLILDGHHVVEAVASVAFAAAGGRIALVTDAIAAAGMPPGLYELGGEPVITREGEPPRRPDGTLAGAVLRLDEAVARAVAIGVPPALAIEAASRVPADLLRRRDLGRIEPGAAADLVWLDDGYRARATWVGGELVHDELGVAA